MRDAGRTAPGRRSAPRLRIPHPVLAMLLLLAMPLHAMPLHAQWRQRAPQPHNVAYDGRFTFARIRYTELYSAGWSYDYPEMEQNFMTLLHEITTLSPHVRRSNILTFDDPELLKFP